MKIASSTILCRWSFPTWGDPLLRNNLTKKPAMPEEIRLDPQKTYAAILDAARQTRYLSYADLARANGLVWNRARYLMPRHLDMLVQTAHKRGWPLLSAIVVRQDSLETGRLEGSAREGLIAAARRAGIEVGDPEKFVAAEQQKVFEWARSAPDTFDDGTGQPPEAETRGSRFAVYMPLVLDALRELSGEARPGQVRDWVLAHHDVPREEIETHTRDGQSVFENRLAWARHYLVRSGLLLTRKRGVWELSASGRETTLSREDADALVREIRMTPVEDGNADEIPAPDQVDRATQLFDDPGRRFWFAGAGWREGDQTNRFLASGIWQNGEDGKFSELVAQMKPGDRIAIKAAFVKRRQLPFDVGGKPVSCMRIKAIGTITEALGDGRTVRVAWEVVDPPQDWYFYTYRTTLVEADPDHHLARRLILFAFAGVPQDYGFWLQLPYWRRKYGSEAPEGSLDLMIEETAELEGDEAEHPRYRVEDIVEEGCFFPLPFLENALHRLRTKKNLILQGPPGTGKTWLAKRLAYALIGSRERAVAKARMRIVQFHPTLSYEDFVRGWRPSRQGGLALVDGVFLESIQAAAAEPDRQFVLIIEEVNRGNPAQIFGEMLTLLEDSKRRPEDAIELAYRNGDDERVFVPPNLHVIGTMNVADRSLALVDLALRRRFAFVTLEPQLGEAWRVWCTKRCGLEEQQVRMVEERLLALNEDIRNDASLGIHFRVGHSYVTPAEGGSIADVGTWFRQVVETEIGPLLDEYWFDAPDRAKRARERLLADLPE